MREDIIIAIALTAVFVGTIMFFIGMDNGITSERSRIMREIVKIEEVDRGSVMKAIVDDGSQR